MKGGPLCCHQSPAHELGVTQGSRIPLGPHHRGPTLSTQVALGQGRGLGAQDMVHDSHPCLGRKLEKLREKERKKEAKRKISSLSFTLEEEEEAGEEEEEVVIYEEELEREGEGRLGAQEGALPAVLCPGFLALE